MSWCETKTMASMRRVGFVPAVDTFGVCGAMSVAKGFQRETQPASQRREEPAKNQLSDVAGSSHRISTTKILSIVEPADLDGFRPKE